jgi:hypothetical protein
MAVPLKLKKRGMPALGWWLMASCRQLALGLHLVVLLRLRVALLSHLLRDTGFVLLAFRC